MQSFARALPALALLLLLASCAGTSDQITYRSTPAGDGIEISAYLAKPAGEGPFPAVILLHGCTGLERDTYSMEWRGLSNHARFLNDNGFVTLIVDSHGSRGITTSEAWTASCRRGKGFRERTGDVYGALDYLESLPFVGKGRIALAGLSQGGSVVFNALGTKAARGRIAAGVVIYPSCGYLGRPVSFYAPILILIGSADDITPSYDCEHLVSSSRTSTMTEGAIVPEIVVYPEVHHSFDLPLLRLEATPIGTVAPDPSATRDARERMLRFLRRYTQA